MNPATAAAAQRFKIRLGHAIMLVITGFYLIWELAFNARLLDVVGNVESHDVVEGIEIWGRLISGTAAAIFILGLRVAKLTKTPGASLTAGWLIATMMICGAAIATVFYAQKFLVDAIVANADAEDRRRAAVLVPMTKLLQAGKVEIPSLAASSEDLTTPEGKSFLATLPLQAFNHKDLFNRIEASGVDAMFAAYAEELRVSAQKQFELFRDGSQELRRLHRGPYKEASDAYARAMGQIPRIQANAWNDFRDALRKQNKYWTPESIPRIYWGVARNKLSAKGLYMPGNWRPSDRATFNRVVAEKATQDANTEFAKGLKAQGIEDGLKPMLSEAAFLREPGVAGPLQKKLQLSRDLDPDPDITYAKFEAVTYKKILADDAERLKESNYAPVSQYQKGRIGFHAGDAAYRALVVPPIALAFSLMGALVHIFKMFAFAVKALAPGMTPYMRIFAAAYVALAVGLPLTVPNSISQQELFGRLEAHTRSAGPGWFVVAGAIRWTTQLQPFFYPINNFARTSVLSSPTFSKSH